jgi:hypothetical protein
MGAESPGLSGEWAEMGTDWIRGATTVGSLGLGGGGVGALVIGRAVCVGWLVSVSTEGADAIDMGGLEAVEAAAVD